MLINTFNVVQPISASFVSKVIYCSGKQGAELQLKSPAVIGWEPRRTCSCSTPAAWEFRAAQQARASEAATSGAAALSSANGSVVPLNPTKHSRAEKHSRHEGADAVFPLDSTFRSLPGVCGERWVASFCFCLQFKPPLTSSDRCSLGWVVP